VSPLAETAAEDEETDGVNENSTAEDSESAEGAEDNAAKSSNEEAGAGLSP